MKLSVPPLPATRKNSAKVLRVWYLPLAWPCSLFTTILAAQFESFKDPFVIMLTVPLAICGALLFMLLGGQTMNIFSQIGIIMLIGLVAKNGILIVEFANQRQAGGEDKFTAIREASVQRLRPILMTSASTVLGLLPWCLPRPRALRAVWPWVLLWWAVCWCRPSSPCLWYRPFIPTYQLI